MDGGAIQTTLGFISGTIVGCGAMWFVMDLKLVAARNTARLFSEWWMKAEDRLEEAHQKHVRAGRTPHEKRRQHVKDVAAQIAISPPAPLRPRDEIEAEGRNALAKRRRGKMKVAA